MTSELPTAVTVLTVPVVCSFSSYSTTHTHYELLIIIFIIRYHLYAVYLQLLGVSFGTRPKKMRISQRIFIIKFNIL
jgi:hypothetical protein